MQTAAQPFPYECDLAHSAIELQGVAALALASRPGVCWLT